MLEKEKFFIEVGSYQNNKFNNIVCGDCVLLRKCVGENRNIVVLSDGLGSGVKANVLSTMTASMAMNFRVRHEPILRTIKAIMDTLPVDSVRNISYSTFTIVDVDSDGEAQIVEFDNPPLLLVRDNSIYKIDSNEIVIKREAEGEHQDERVIKISDLKLKKEDRLICFSDGVSQSGIGNRDMPFGWEDGINDFVKELIEKHPRISARELSMRIVKQAELNDILKPKDDTSCVVLYVREPRRLLICTGPPFSESKDKYLAEIVNLYKGKKIVCGGTTSQILSRELKREITVNIDDIAAGLPPSSQMEGIDLMTEGIITLGALSELLRKGMNNNVQGEGPAWEIYRMILDADIIDLVVGTKINVAHQDPSLPVELEIRRNVVKNIAMLLEEKFMKEVRLKFI
ncbi:MAG: SpoIIE family protein phosphatase [Bacteroidales bacterium]|nr:SpoIIE family protein phosphatase [Bacteroidales bacterium]